MDDLQDIYAFTAEELLSVLYVKEILQENVSSDFFSNEEILSAITFKYLEEYGVCNLTNQELIKWLQDNYRYCLLNELIKMEIIKIGAFQDKNDNFLFNNFEVLLQIVAKEVKDIFLSQDDFKVVENKKITEEEFEKLVVKFLQKIDPSLDWLNIYKEALENKQIHFIDAKNLEEKQRLFNRFGLDLLTEKVQDLPWNFTIIDTIVNKGEVHLVIEKNHDIRDFWSFIHEFIHFMEYKKNGFKESSLLLREFPAITYEKLALEFLISEGYDIKEIKQMSHLRNSDVYKAGIEIIPVLTFMEKVLLNGQISKEEELKNAKLVVNLNNKLDEKTKEEQRKNKPYYFDALEYSNHFCDEAIKFLVIDNQKIQSNYPYVIGNYLSNLMVEKIKSKELDYKTMKKIVENISNIKPYALFNVLGVDLKKNKLSKKLYLV